MLVSEERWACKKHWYAGDGIDVGAGAANGGSVFFVRLVTDTFLHWPVYSVDG